MTRYQTVANKVTREELTHTDGKLFNSRTCGFGSVVIETNSTGWKYIGDDWNKAISFEDIVVKSCGNMGNSAHAWCINEDGRFYDYDD